MIISSYSRLHSLALFLKVILCWTIMLSSFEQIVAISPDSTTPPDANYLTEMQKTKQKCNLLEQSKRNECYLNDCSTVFANNPDSELHCRIDSCEMQYPSGETKHKDEKTQCYTSTLKEKSVASGTLSILEAIPATFGLLTVGHLILTLMKYLLNFTIFRNRSGCAFPSVALATSWGIIDNILAVISVVIFIKHTRNLYNDFKTKDLPENKLRENSFRYMEYKYEILEKYITRQLVLMSISLAITLIAIGLALKEIAMGGGFCPVSGVATSNNSNNWINIILSMAFAEEITDDLVKQGTEVTGVSSSIDNYLSNPNIEEKKEGTISSTIGLSSSDVGKFLLYGGAIFSVIAAIFGMFDLAITVLYPFFKGTWNSTGKMSTTSAVGRVILFTILSAVKIAIIVAEAIILKNIKERQRLLRAIEEKLKSYSFFDFFNLPISIPIIDAYANEAGTSESPLVICVDANKKIDVNCLCAKKNSCFQLNAHIATPFLKEYPEAKKIIPLFQYINDITGGRDSLENASLASSKKLPGQEELAQMNLNLFNTILKKFDLQKKELSRGYGGPFSANIVIEKWLANRPFEVLKRKGGPLANLLEPESYLAEIPDPILSNNKELHQLNGLKMGSSYNDNNISNAVNAVNAVNIIDSIGPAKRSSTTEIPSFDESFKYNTIHSEPQKDLWQIISGVYIKRYSTMQLSN